MQILKKLFFLLTQPERKRAGVLVNMILVIIGPRRLGDSPRLVGDTTHIRRDLGWRPVYADLNSILTTAWHWHSRPRETRLLIRNHPCKPVIQH